MSEPIKFIATFQQRSDKRNCYVEVFAVNRDAASAKMYMEYPGEWSMLYDNEESAGVTKHNLKFIGQV